MASRDNNLLAQLEWEDDDNDPDYVDAEEGDEEEYELEEMDVDIDEQAPDEDEDEDPLADERIDAMGSVSETLNMLRQAAASGSGTLQLPAGFDVVSFLRAARSMGFGLSSADSTGSTRRRQSDEDYSRLEHPDSFAAHSEPQDAGIELLQSGQFGDPRIYARLEHGDRNFARYFARRQCSQRPGHNRRQEFMRGVLPNCSGTVMATFDDDVYSGQHSLDGRFYYTCCRNYRLDVFATGEPRVENTISAGRRGFLSSQSAMRRVSTTSGLGGGYTVTDSHLSPDNERLIYATMSRSVYLTRTGLHSGINYSGDDNTTHTAQQTPLRFHLGPARDSRRRHIFEEGDDDVQIWSCRFSADGQEIVAGGSQHIFVYDLQANQQTVQIPAHDWDINSCCWADTASGNVLISGSDDTFVKVWDRRSLGTAAKPSGVLIGHVEGITYVAPKGDGRYVISNGKDQSLRLWDLRMMKSNEDYIQCRSRSYGDPNFDYRYGIYPRLRRQSHPLDCSVMQYRGHQVMRTLIRCNFSPTETTGQSYIYSGSSNGYIHIWSIDGREVQKIDRAASLPISFDPSEADPADLPRARAIARWGRQPTGVVVRDVSWHPREASLMSTAWESQNMKSNVARHEWKGLSKNAATIGAGVLEDIVNKEMDETRERKRRRLRVPGEYTQSEASDD